MAQWMWALLAAAVAVALLGGLAWRALVRRRRRSDASRAYLQGFRYILSDKPDAALEELTRAAELDARTLETYFALGALFRRTGEHERAIRLHQNMLLKAGPEAALRQQIELELGQDFQKAGVPEKAVESYRAVVQASPGHKEALTRLRELFEGQRSWAQAAEVEAERVKAGDGSRAVLAHLLSEAALGEVDKPLALELAQRACQIEPGSAHAHFAAGVRGLSLGQAEAARQALEKACELDPEVCSRASEPLLQIGVASAREAMAGQLSKREHPATLLALARCERQGGAVEQAVQHLRRALDLDPRSVEARVELGRALLEGGVGEEARRELEALLAALGQQEPGFVCKSCGHGYAEAQWRCQRCGNWDSVERGTAISAESPGAKAQRDGSGG